MNWIVTGSSRGIGAATAHMAAARGASVVVNYSVDAEGAATVVASIREAGGRAVAVQADIAREADVLRLFETADREFGAPAVLVNNAAITGGFRRVEDVTEELLTRVFAVNVTGSILCAREAVRRFSTRRGGQGGAIVNITSRAAALGSPNEWVHYAATKGAIDTFTVGLAREVAAEGIRVNAIAAGLIETGMHRAAGAPDRVTRMAPGIPMQRSASPEEVAEAVLWLASPAASYVTGAILPVSGGR
jgi:NAD(P)-dependent dehydrogenase (short-subunit alcohol dehydrogenase family)